ncbi:hypothetical protein Tco_0261401 [Tanacetum coccineum]
MIWSRSHCLADHYNYLTSNCEESIDSLSRKARKLPVTMLIEFFKELLHGGEDELTPRAAVKVEDNIQKSYGLSMHGIDVSEYQVLWSTMGEVLRNFAVKHAHVKVVVVWVNDKKSSHEGHKSKSVSLRVKHKILWSE